MYETIREIIGNTTTTPMAVADWEQSDEKKADFIKNKPSLGQLATKDSLKYNDLTDKPFGEGVTETIVFDGVVGDKTAVPSGSAVLVKVSDKIFSVDDIIGSVVTMNDGSSVTLPEDMVTEVDSIVVGASVVFSVSKENATLGASGTIIPETGTYFVCNTELSQYVQSLTIVSGGIKTLDEKYIPDTIARVSDVDAKIAAIPTPDVSGQIDAHNTNAESHNDIRLAISNLATRFDAFEESSAVYPSNIDMTNLDNGIIVEKYTDGTTKTTTMEFDADGNPVKITDGDGNETVLTW